MVAVRAECWMQITWNRQEFTLPPLNHHASQLIAEDEHSKGGHLGITATFARIQCHFWITILQRLVKSSVTSASYARENSKD